MVAQTMRTRVSPHASLLSLLPALAVLSACGDDSGAGGAGATGGGGSGAGFACAPERTAADDAAPPPLHTPRWAFRPWISKDISNGPDTYDFVEGFEARDIPVGVVVLDSPWETNYNTFVPNPERYPDFGDMVADLRARDVRVVLWVTQMINDLSFDVEPNGDFYSGPAENFAEPLACGWFVNDGETYGWWKGRGAGIDFFHPDARAFWHRLQDPLFDLGVAGFKLDFGESYIRTSEVRTHAGTVPHQEYSEAYYRDFYAYGAARVGLEEFVTMVRPYDKSYDFEGRFFARPEHAPVAWVGDNRRDYVGLVDALDHIFRSAAAGYVVVGSDLGGYLDRDDANVLGEENVKIPLDPVNFMRWTAQSALTPFMQLHGRANITPWTFPERSEEVVANYRFWAKLHDELVPFFYAVAEQAYAGGPVRMIEPLGVEAEWPGDYRYLLGGAMLVAPVIDDTGLRDVELPDGATWYPLLDPSADALAGGQLLEDVDVSDPTRIPVFVREGAILPMNVADDVTGFGTSASAGALSFAVWPGPESESFVTLLDDDSPLELSSVASASAIELTLGAGAPDVVLRVRLEAAPAEVTLDGAPLVLHADRAAFEAAASGAYFDAGARLLWVRVPAASAARSIGVAKL